MNLQLKHISFSHSPGKRILKDISLSLEEQKIYALMGSNGAGKTTLFNLISGFIKPQSGEIFFGEINLTYQKPYKINRQGIGRTFQDLRLINKLSVKENIVLAMQQNPTDNWLTAMLPENFHRITNAAQEKKANEIVEQFFLSDVINSLAAEISYGQQKLLSLACCVANGANLLLLDEAVAGIQPEYRNKIAMLIKQLKEQGKTILLIEHNTDFIADVADKIFFLHDGEISTFENMETLRKDKQVMEAYI
ncbi:MAG: ATP-binding cassette domain-containing protein [Saprospiraceae bacterium]|nr:ATP-binding cassette domain-containing protein [Candidatus Defluviibacterium haderslevense]